MLQDDDGADRYDPTPAELDQYLATKPGTEPALELAAKLVEMYGVPEPRALKVATAVSVRSGK